MGYVMVQKGNGVEFHWDSDISIRYNIKAFLDGYNPEEDSEQSFDGYLTGSHSRAELEAARDLLKASEKSQSEEAYLEQVIEPFLNKLHGHRNGKPSLLYAILQHAVRESTEKRLKSIVTIEQEIKALEFFPTEIAKLEEELESSRKAGLELQKRYKELKVEVESFEKEFLKISNESRGLQDRVTLLDKKISSVMATNNNLEARYKLPRNGTDVEKKDESITYRKQYSERLLKTISRNESRQLELSERYENKKRELKEVVDRQKQLKMDTERMRGSLSSIATTAALNVSFDNNSEMTNIAKFSKYIRNLWGGKEEPSNGSVVSAPEEVVQREKRTLVPMLTSKPVKTDGDTLRKIDIGSGKSFYWNESKGLCDNIEDLMRIYLDSPGYHSPDRVEAANKMLSIISGLRTNDKIDNDKMRDAILIGHIRQQNIPSHGFNKKRSMLQSIFLKAEFSYDAMIRKEYNIKKKESEKLKSESMALIVRKENLKNMIKDSEGRNVSLQERYGNLQMRRVEIKEKTASEKESIKSQKSVIEQKRQDLLMCQQTSLTLGIQCNSSNLTPRGEAKFLREQLSHLDVLKSTTEKVDDLEDQIVVTEREIERLKSENEIAATELQVAYHEVRRISKGYEGLAMAEVKDKSSTNVMAENVATFADAFEVAHQNKEDLGGPKF